LLMCMMKDKEKAWKSTTVSISWALVTASAGCINVKDKEAFQTSARCSCFVLFFLWGSAQVRVFKIAKRWRKFMLIQKLLAFYLVCT